MDDHINSRKLQRKANWYSRLLDYSCGKLPNLKKLGSNLSLNLVGTNEWDDEYVYCKINSQIGQIQFQKTSFTKSTNDQ